MAKKLKKFEYANKLGRRRYNWDTWLNGEPWRLIKGEDFKSKLSSFRTNAWSIARRRGGNLLTSVVDPNTIDIQFVKNEA